MATLPFTKVEGLGNDFVVVDLRNPAGGAASAAVSIQEPAIVRAVCDRHFGVGADGVLAILPGVAYPWSTSHCAAATPSLTLSQRFL